MVCGTQEMGKGGMASLRQVGTCLYDIKLTATIYIYIYKFIIQGIYIGEKGHNISLPYPS